MTRAATISGWLFTIGLISVVSTESPCQGMAHLGGSYNISAKIVYSHFVWVRPHDNQNVVTCSPTCSGTTTYSSTQKNADNITTLSIGRVQFRDAGTWAISNTTSDSVRACHLTVAGLPNCTITSSLPHDSLEPNSELTLVADIRGYYCSKQAGFELTTGRDVPEVLLKNNTVTGVTDIVLNTTFNVTLKRLGNVQLDFTCADTTFHLSCRGVTQLLKIATNTSPPTTTSTSTQRPSVGSTDAVKPGPQDNTVVIVVCVVFGVLLIAGAVIGVIISKIRRSRNIPEEVLDERPFTTLQHEASVSQKDGVIRNDDTQGTSPSTEVLDERPYTTLQHEASVPHEYGVIRNDNTQGTSTSPSTDGTIYEDCLTN